MEVTPGYKQSEVGVIPEEWDVKKIGELCDYQNGTSLERLFTHDDGLKVISIGNYSVTGQYIDNGVYISHKHRKMVEKFVLSENDLTMSLNDKTSVGAIIGRVLLIDKSDLFVFNQRTMRLRPKHTVSPVYLYHVINADSAHNAIVGLAKPGTQIYVNTDDVIDLKLPVPPLPEQRAIAGALSDVDALIGALDQLIAKKRDLKQAAMQQLLTGQTRLPGFHGEWEEKRFADVAFPRRERVDPRRTGVHEFCVELEHIESASAALLGSTSTGGQSSFKSVFRTGDVLFGKLRAYLRKYWLATRSGVCSTEIWVLVPNDRLITTDFLFQMIKTDSFIEAASNAYGTHMPRSDWNLVKNYEMQVPPLPEQTAIAEVLSDMDAELAALEQRRDKTRALKQGMMQELLTGRIRLIN